MQLLVHICNSGSNHVTKTKERQVIRNPFPDMFRLGEFANDWHNTKHPFLFLWDLIVPSSESFWTRDKLNLMYVKTLVCTMMPYSSRLPRCSLFSFHKTPHVTAPVIGLIVATWPFHRGVSMLNSSFLFCERQTGNETVMGSYMGIKAITQSYPLYGYQRLQI